MSTIKNYQKDLHKDTSDKNHYVYRHIRLDTNEPFYIGIGTSANEKSIGSYFRYFRRAYSNSKRNNFWKRVVAKTFYEVEILLESEDYEFIKQKEIEFITLYGRRDLNKGTLVNLTDGGDKGVEHRTIESIEKQRLFWANNTHPTKGIPRTEEVKEKMRISCKGRGAGELNYFYKKSFKGVEHQGSKAVFNTIINVKYDSIKEASEKENIIYSTLKSKLNGRIKNNTNLIYYNANIKKS